MDRPQGVQINNTATLKNKGAAAAGKNTSIHHCYPNSIIDIFKAFSRLLYPQRCTMGLHVVFQWPIDSNEVRGWSMRCGRSSQLAAETDNWRKSTHTHALNLNVKHPSANIVLKYTHTVVGSHVFPHFCHFICRLLYNLVFVSPLKRMWRSQERIQSPQSEKITCTKVTHN